MILVCSISGFFFKIASQVLSLCNTGGLRTEITKKKKSRTFWWFKTFLQWCEFVVYIFSSSGSSVSVWLRCSEIKEEFSKRRRKQSYDETRFFKTVIVFEWCEFDKVMQVVIISECFWVVKIDHLLSCHKLYIELNIQNHALPPVYKM